MVIVFAARLALVFVLYLIVIHHGRYNNNGPSLESVALSSAR